MADAAETALSLAAATISGDFFIDGTVLTKPGVTDFNKNSLVVGSRSLLPDLLF